MPMQPLVKNNVVMLHNDSVLAHISKFLDRLSVDSASTSVEYKRDIQKFFKLMLGKELNELEVRDLDIKKIDIEGYQTFLLDYGYKASSINRMIASVKSLYNSFEENGFKYKDDNGDNIYIKSAPLNVDKLRTNDSDSYGMIEHEEMKDMIRRAKYMPNGVEKSLFLEFASVTSFRLEAITNLDWNDFRKESDTWVVKTLDDKGKVHEKSIRTDLYERMLETKKDDKVFHMTSRTIERVIETLVKDMNIDPERNIKFHSIKKYGIMEVWMATGGDIIKTAEQGNHSSFETTKKYYMMFKKNYASMPSLLIGQEVDINPIKEMSKDELIALIESCDRELQFSLLNKIKKTGI
jgi:integrase